MRYATACAYKSNEKKAYRTYVTDMLRLIPQMRYITTRWADIGKVTQDNRTADDIDRRLREG